MRYKIFNDILNCFVASFIVFIFVPIFVISDSLEDYYFIEVPTFLESGLLFSLLFGLFFSFICIFLYIAKFYKTSALFSSFVLLWVLIAGFLLPVSESSGMVDPKNIPVDVVNIIIVMLIAAALSFVCANVSRKYVNVFVYVLIVTSTIQALTTIYRSDIIETHHENHESRSISNKKNILVISFDGTQGRIIGELIRNNEKYAKELKDFIVFDNAVSQSPATAASLLGEVYGSHDYKLMGHSRKQVKKYLDENGITDALLYNQVEDSYSLTYDLPRRLKFDKDEVKISSDQYDTFEFFRYPIARVWTKAGIRFLEKIDFFDIIESYILDDADSLRVRFRKHNGSGQDKANIKQLGVYKAYVSKLSVRNVDFSIRFLHFKFTHFPIDLDEQCNYRSDDKAWFNDNNNEKGIRGQTTCALNQFIDLLHKLKSLSVYNNSLIVFKSDHGKPSYYFTAYPDNLIINNHYHWGYNRYRPNLMIKDFGANNANIIFKKELVLLNDLSKTLCESSGLNLDCNRFPGVNILGDNLSSTEPYYIYVPKDRKSSFKFESHISVKIPSRNISLVQAMKGSKLIKLSIDRRRKNLN